LAFLAMVWVVILQFRDHPISGLGASSGLLAKGYLGSDLYLVIAGFLATALFAAGPKDWRGWESVAWRRIGPNYPLHLVTIAAMALLFVVASVAGSGFDPAPFGIAALPQNVLLVQAWGTLPTVYWNFPSWMLSAELAGCVLIPAFATAGRGGARASFLAFAIAVLLFGAMFLAAQKLGILFTDMTAQIGALRAVPDFLIGASVWGLARSVKPTALESASLAVASLVWIALASIARLSDLAIWPAFGPLVLAVVTLRGALRRLLTSPEALYLGRIAWAVYLVHLPVEIAWFHMLDRLFGNGAVPADISLFGVLALILVAAIGAYHLVQVPAWRALKRLGDEVAPRPVPRAA
jgi:peptidoglycan/LPS O-acetylase OafA/YrhL